MKLRMILLGLGVMLVAGVALEPLSELFAAGDWERLVEALGTGARAFVMAVVVAPLLEEFLFRALLCRGLARWWKNDVWAIAVSSVFFAAAHYPVWPQMPGALAGGLVLGAAYRITRTIWVPVAIHALNNFGAWLSMENTDDIASTLRGSIGNDLVYWALWAVCAALFVLGMRKLHNILRPKTLTEK